MIAVTYDVYGERIRAEVYVDETEDHVVIDIRHHWGTASRLHRADAVALLRAMLREIAGPSIDDVREVWGVAHDCIDVSGADARDDTADVCVFADGLDWYYSAKTLREAMQAAYDAGVARAAAAVPPA